jgi:hypothetical protein
LLLQATIFMGDAVWLEGRLVGTLRRDRF